MWAGRGVGVEGVKKGVEKCVRGFRYEHEIIWRGGYELWKLEEIDILQTCEHVSAVPYSGGQSIAMDRRIVVVNSDIRS